MFIFLSEFLASPSVCVITRKPGMLSAAGAGSKPRRLYPKGPLWETLIETLLPSVARDVVSIVHGYCSSTRLFCVGSAVGSTPFE
jgi:hypothetical protein